MIGRVLFLLMKSRFIPHPIGLLPGGGEAFPPQLNLMAETTSCHEESTGKGVLLVGVRRGVWAWRGNPWYHWGIIIQIQVLSVQDWSAGYWHSNRRWINRSPQCCWREGTMQIRDLSFESWDPRHGLRVLVGPTPLFKGVWKGVRSTWGVKVVQIFLIEREGSNGRDHPEGRDFPTRALPLAEMILMDTWWPSGVFWGRSLEIPQIFKTAKHCPNKLIWLASLLAYICT